MSGLFKTSPFEGRAQSAAPAQDAAAASAPRARIEQSRALLLVGLFGVLAIVLGLRMATISLAEGEGVSDSRPEITAPSAPRAPIVDREGRLLAVSIPTWEISANPRAMRNPRETAAALSRIFPELSISDLERRLDNNRKFVWISRRATPDQWLAVLNLGNPHLEGFPRWDRFYPGGRVAAHLMGGVGVDGEGLGGIERAMQDRLSDPTRAQEPVRLSIDLRAQTALRSVLMEEMARYAALGAAAVVIDSKTGEIVAMVSLPDFDPNAPPPAPATFAEAASSPAFDRTSQGAYELGSVFKLFTVAAALDGGYVTLDTIVDATHPIQINGFEIDDYKGKHRPLSVEEVVRYSSNIGAARIAQAMGADPLRAILKSTGMLDRVGLELPEAETAKPRLPAKWGLVETMTVAFGHGIAVSPLHLATGVSALANGGCMVQPTLLRRQEPIKICVRVIKESTSQSIRWLMRAVATAGARPADIPGYEVGGKTGTAEKLRPEGGYDKGRNLNTFVGVFPMSDPRYTVLATLDDPKNLATGDRSPIAGQTAAPTVGAIIRRIAPLLGVAPIYGGVRDEAAVTRALAGAVRQ